MKWCLAQQDAGGGGGVGLEEEEEFAAALEEVLRHGVQVVGGADPPPCKLSPHQLLGSMKLKVFLEVSVSLGYIK